MNEYSRLYARMRAEAVRVVTRPVGAVPSQLRSDETRVAAATALELDHKYLDADTDAAIRRLADDECECCYPTYSRCRNAPP